MTSNIPYEILEERAARQRRELHNRVAELRSTLSERLDVKRATREYIWPAAGIVGSVSLLVGYGIAGLFARN